MSAARLPQGFVAVTRPSIGAFAWCGTEDWANRTLDEASTLYAWAAMHALESRSGRGPVHVVEAPVAGPAGAGRWAVRHYARGGAASGLLGDRYWALGRERPERELVASEHLRSVGIRTPAVVAGAQYRAGASGALGFYRADLVTEHVPHAHTLAATLVQGGEDPLGALSRSGRLLRAVAEAGVLHVDLNARNILLDDEGEAWVLDLDRARLRPPGHGRLVTTMLARLERSLTKLEVTHARALSSTEWHALREGAGKA